MRHRILVFSGHFAPHVGGVERYTRELWGRLARRGHEVSIFTSNTDGAPARERVDGMDVTRVPVVQVMQGRLPITLPSPALLRAVRDHARRRPAVVVTNTRFFTTSVLGVALARRWGVPALHVDHGSEHIPIPTAVAGAAAHAFDHAVGGWVLRNATRCVGVSASVAGFLAHLGRAGAGVLHNGVDTGRFERRDPSWRPRLGIPSDRPFVLFVGRLIEDKGAGVLLDAFDAAGPPLGAHLVVAGDGPMMPALRARAQGRRDVHLLGFVGPDDVAGLLGACDVFAHPSAYPEGLPTSVLEAGAAGAAVVATPMGGTAEVVTSEREGLLVPPRDPAALAAALRALLGDATLRAAKGAALRERVRRVFDWERVADAAEAEIAALAAPLGRAGRCA
jgi:glycosyltransferase involved in cell wall biosynthesis